MNQTEMPLYEGKKKVRAYPMDRYDFLLQVKKMAIDQIKENEENQCGYIVVYQDGYTSWSPKKIFEEAYRICETPIDLVNIELNDLTEKFEKLTLSLLEKHAKPTEQSDVLVLMMEEYRNYIWKSINILKEMINTMQWYENSSKCIDKCKSPNQNLIRCVDSDK